MTPQGLQKALEYYRQAVAIHPTYGVPYAGIAWSYCLLGWWGHVPDAEAYPAARQAALKALSLDQELSGAHRVLHWVRWLYDWDLAESEKEIRRALELNPNDSEARLHQALFLTVGCQQAAEGLAEARVALDLDPLSRYINTMVGWVQFFAGKYDLALEQGRQTLELYPDTLHAWCLLGHCELARNRYSEALALFQRAAAISQDPITLSYVAHTQAKAGNRAEAQRVLDVLLTKAKDSYVIPRSLGWIYLGLGDYDRFMQFLEQGFACRDGTLWLALGSSFPAIDPLRSDPRFLALVHRMGFGRR
jgi:serine/threonine-protein kinase